MNKLTAKSIVYLPLMAIAVGIIPVLILPPGEGLNLARSVKLSELSSYTEAVFPFYYGARELVWIELALLVPVLMSVWSLLAGKKSYHGLYAVFIAAGFILKSQSLDMVSQALLVIMLLAGAVNIWVYLSVKEETFDDWLRHYFGKFRSRERYVSSGEGTVRTLDSGKAPEGQSVTNYAMIAKSNFNRLVGMQEFKDRLLKVGQEALSSKPGQGGRNGILLGGEPGNGKTAMAEALAGSLNIPIISVSFGSVASMWINETTQKVMKVFDDAEIQAPCMLFIDEIDAILVDRGRVQNADSESSKTVAAVLKRLESIRNRGVVVVAATNFVDRLDPASIREGRFDFKMDVPPPDFEARKFLLSDKLKSVVHLVNQDGLERAAKRWEGFSVARIRAVASEALDMLKDNKISRIGFDELALALRTLSASKGTRIPEDALTVEQLVLSIEMRERMQKLANRMVNIERIEEMGGSVPYGVLFSGPPGTGKTIGAMALAKASNWAFIATTGHDLLHDPAKIDDILKTAKEIRPCIVFIDEADDVLADRRGAMLSKDVTNKLLTAMDGAKGKTKDVLFIASTNAPDLIDDAMLRGGRFTEKIAFELPNEDAVLTYVQNWMRDTKAPLGNDFIANDVALMLNGESLANAKEILQTAVNEAVSGGESADIKVTLTHLKSAIQIVKGTF